MSGFTWFWPGLAVVLVTGWVLVPPLSRMLRIDRRLACLLLVGIGLVLAVEVTPLRGPFGIDLAVPRGCDLGRRWFATIPQVTAVGDVTLGIALYVPAGLAIGLLPISRRSAVVIAGVLALPGLLEWIQLVVPSLARGCQSGDAIDGLTGLGIGVGLGLLIRLLRHALVGGGPATPS